MSRAALSVPRHRAASRPAATLSALCHAAAATRLSPRSAAQAGPPLSSVAGFSMIRRLLMLLALYAVATASPAAETARAWLDRDSLQLGETVTLNIESSESASEPDFSALDADFELLGRSSSSSVSISNGRTTSSMLWAVGLRPRREGKLTIPPLTVGKARTEAVALTVGAAPAVAAANAGDDFFLDVTADPQLVYVQQQVRVTVRFYYAVNQTDGAVEELSLPDAVVQKLGQDRSYDAERAGRRYRVMERRYAVTAQKSGSLVLPALNFRGRALSGNDPNALFFGRGRAVETRSEATTIEVKPRPAASAGGAWLPAQSLQLQIEGVTAATPARVGEPLTVTVTVIAQGLGFEQLPEIELPAIAGAEVYPDKSVTRSRESSGWVVGERSRKFAIVPKHAGKLQIPALSLDWWNVAEDAAAKATTESVTVDVAEAANQPAAAPAAAAPAVATQADLPADSGSAMFWRLAAIVGFLLWLATLAVLLLVLRRLPRRAAAAAPSVAFSPTRRSFERAVADGDAAAAAQRLLAWARSEGLRANHLGELAAQLTAPAQREAIARLQAVLYGAAGGTLPPGLAAAFAQGFSGAATVAANDAASVLPPLWGGR